MKFLPILAALAMASPALAQMGPPPASADRSAHHEQMCVNHYANAVGKLAALEVRLSLTAAQKGPFEKWKSVKLADAKTASANCAEMKPPSPDASIMDQRQHQIAHLEARLASLKAETPALEALVKVLTPEQQKILRHAAMKAMHDGMDGRHGMMGRGHDRMPPMGMHDAPPPPDKQ